MISREKEREKELRALVDGGRHRSKRAIVTIEQDKKSSHLKLR